MDCRLVFVVWMLWSGSQGFLFWGHRTDEDGKACYRHCEDHPDLATCVLDPNSSWQCDQDEFCDIVIYEYGKASTRCYDAEGYEWHQCQREQSHNYNTCDSLVPLPFGKCHFCCPDGDCVHRIAHVTTTATTTTATTTTNAVPTTTIPVKTAPPTTNPTTTIPVTKAPSTPNPTTTIPVKTTTPTTTATLKPTTTQQGVPPSCAVCDDFCILSQQDQPCPSGFCMTSITDDESFSRVVKKSCVTEDECYKRWWQETSDQPLCLSILSESSGPTGVATSCNYCCHGDKCNSPDFPSKDTLYDGNNKGNYPVG